MNNLICIIQIFVVLLPRIYTIKVIKSQLLSNINYKNEALWTLLLVMNILEAGGLPGLRNFNITDSREVSDYQRDVFNTVLLKDVILRGLIISMCF